MATQRFERRERRYLVRDARTLLKHLARHAEPVVYQVNTLYVDWPQATWSTGDGSAVKLRLRQYGADAPWWFEHKRCEKGRVVKDREPVRRLPAHLRLIASVHYTRTAFDCDDVRVTVDERVLSARGLLAGRVVEVKGDPPAWLAKRLPAQARGFSKSAWALGQWDPPKRRH